MDGSGKDLKPPAELFDSVADNLIDNAFNKTGAQVRVTLLAARGGTLTVCDNGAPIAKSTESRLFEGPVPSESGLGVGLYHSARQAAQLGYRLALASNQPGTVCFALRRADEAGRS